MIINKNQNKLTEAQQKEIVERCNEAYDKGGSDVLKIVIDTAKQIAVDNPMFSDHVAFTLYVVEGIRESLKKRIDEQIHDVIPKVIIN